MLSFVLNKILCKYISHTLRLNHYSEQESENNLFLDVQ